MKKDFPYLKYFKSVILILAILQFSFVIFPHQAEAAFSVGFATESIRITSPQQNGLPADGQLEIAGTSSLQSIWLCVRGPEKEVYVYPVNVKNGEFSQKIALRFGPGTYTVWAGNNPKKFDGRIRFEVINQNQDDARYLAPSAYVDSDNPEIIKLAASLVKPGWTDMEKLTAIHNWVTENIAYDMNAYEKGDCQLKKASRILADRKGLCRDFSFLVSALCRAVNLPAKVIYGDAQSLTEGKTQSHAWNEVYAGGRWIDLDATWDAGFIQNGHFVFSPSVGFFATDESIFNKTHHTKMTALF